MTKKLVLILSLLLLSSLLKAEQSARSLVEQAVQNSDLYGTKEISDFLLTIETQEYRKGELLESHSLSLKVLKEQGLNKAKVRYSQPSSLKGTTYLVYINQQQNKPEGIWVYLPSFDKTKRLSALKAKKNLPDALSSLSIFDSREVNFDDYVFTLAQEEQGLTMIEMTPAKKSLEHLSVWLDNETHVIVKVLSKNADAKVLEEVSFGEYSIHGSVKVPHKITTHTIANEKTLTIAIQTLEFNQGSKASEFELDAIRHPF